MRDYFSSFPKNWAVVKVTLSNKNIRVYTVAIIQLEREKLVIKDVKSRVSEAAALLRSLGGDYQRVAWLIEDSLSYIDEAFDEASQGRDDSDEEKLKQVNDSEY